MNDACVCELPNIVSDVGRANISHDALEYVTAGELKILVGETIDNKRSAVFAAKWLKNERGGEKARTLLKNIHFLSFVGRGMGFTFT